jgi:Uma2 family endonuclease
MSGTTTPTDAKPITGEELALLPDVGPCELVEGRIVPMSPTGGEHGRIESNFGEAITAFARSRKLGKVPSHRSTLPGGTGRGSPF